MISKKLQIAFWIGLLALLTNCGGPQKRPSGLAKEPPKASRPTTPAALKILEQGKNDYATGQLTKAMKIFERVLREHPNTQAAVDAHFFQMKTLVRLGRQSEIGTNLAVLDTLIQLAELETKFDEKQYFRLKAIDLVETKLTKDELDAAASSSRYAIVRPTALFRLGNFAYEQQDFSRAKSYFRDLINIAPQSELGEKAATFVNQIDARYEVDSRTVGTVLPLTGRHAAIAQKTLKGLQLGLGIYGPNRSDFKLAVVDSEASPDIARKGVERLVTEDHVIAVVGSLLSKTSVAVASKTNELGVPSFALSQKSGLTDIGDYVFRNALTSEMQVRQLVNVAMTKYNMRRFAILYPNDPYGIEYANIFWDEVLARGGTIAGAQPYDTKETDFSGPIQRLVGTYYLEDRQDEYKLLVKEWAKKQKVINTRVQPPSDLLPPVVDFEGLFIPDGLKALGQIAPMLAFHEISGIRLLGTNLWNSPSLVSRGQKYVEGALFVDGINPTDPVFRSSPFFQLFKETYGEEPGIFEAQAYEVGLLLRQVISSGSGSRVGLKERLAEYKGFQGILGGLGLNARRELLHPLVSLKVSNGQVDRD